MHLVPTSIQTTNSCFASHSFVSPSRSHGSTSLSRPINRIRRLPSSHTSPVVTWFILMEVCGRFFLQYKVLCRFYACSFFTLLTRKSWTFFSSGVRRKFSNLQLRASQFGEISWEGNTFAHLFPLMSHLIVAIPSQVFFSYAGL